TRTIRAGLVNPALNEAAGPGLVVVTNLTVALRPLSDAPYVPSYVWTMPRSFGDGKVEIRAGLPEGSYWLGVGLPMPDGLYAGTGKVRVEAEDPGVVELRIAR